MNTGRCKVIDSRSVGIFDPNDWLKEGDGLLASAKVNRVLWQRRRRSFSRSINSENNTKPHDKVHMWNELCGLPRASMLLLGYSVEMFLKGGLAKAYIGCRPEMFDRDVRCFSHNLGDIAREVNFIYEPGDKDSFAILRRMIVVGARYPVKVNECESYIDITNQRTDNIWDNDSSSPYLSLRNARVLMRPKSTRTATIRRHEKQLG